MSWSERVNTTLSGSGRVDSTKWLPNGELRGQTKLVKITEDVRKFAAEQELAEDKALQAGMAIPRHREIIGFLAQRSVKTWTFRSREFPDILPQEWSRREASEFAEKGRELYVP